MEEQVLELHNQGKSPAEIGKALNIPPYQVVLIINTNNG